jgi:hypothetical protein
MIMPITEPRKDPVDIEQDRTTASTVDRADIHADQDQHRVVGRHAEGQRREQRDSHGSCEARQHTDDDSQLCGPEYIEYRSKGQEIAQPDAQHFQSFKHIGNSYGRRIRKT